MDVTTTVDLTREAMLVALWISAPALIVGMLVGLGIGLLQALTQIQDQTVSFVPKLLAMAAAMLLALPWVLERLMIYTETLVTHIPDRLMGG
ncbi:flagellar biosynthetic protein FliQ [Blastopirellula marina]|uniref:Flagellar biosynthetic protein FliQ n=1 Tax=Blastopirellula marina TaxID=124 RepID=A0A2S8GRS9_9BACT|nr:flagellar biosynthetic protein FliQ [Blastopirellula marina]PQO26254.1 flagellar biosynthetic protein FliQ [Blastopirellula marina]PQO47133.1 flagellar biosynthetic protein FliQ [Blastopirellula marina]PTL40654.1 flagellar type III secretion system protein FliQ [Blastopirellula marina]